MERQNSNKSRSAEMVVSNTPDLTPIVLSQLQTTTKMKEENRKLRRGSRSSQNSTPGNLSSEKSFGNSVCSNGGHVAGIPILDSGSECEDAHIRTAEAFMSGIKSAITASMQSQDGGTGPELISTANGSVLSAQHDTGAGLSAELVGEVNSVLSKLMSSLNTCDPSLIPLITNLQTSLKATVNKPDSFGKKNDGTTAPAAVAAAPPVGLKKDEALSEFSHNENPFFDNIDEKVYTTSKIPWKIRAARKRATKHHTTGMTKDEFARIKKSLDESAINFSAGPSQPYALARNKSEGAIQYQLSAARQQGQVPQNLNQNIPSTYQNTEGSRPYANGGNSTAEANATDMGYTSDVCDYSLAPGLSTSKKGSPGSSQGGSPRGAGSKRLDDSYVQQRRPVSMAHENDISAVEVVQDMAENRTHTPSSPRRNSKSSNTGVRAKIARRKMMRQAAESSTLGVSDQDGSEAYDEEDSVEEKQDSESMNDANSLKPKQLSLLTGDDSSSSMYSSSDWTPETARKNWNFRFANIKHSFNAASEEDLAVKSRSPSLHHGANEPEDRGRNKFKSISPTKRMGVGAQDYLGRITPLSERAQSKEDKNKLNAAMTASSKGYTSETGTLAPLPSSVVSMGPKRSAPDLYAQSKSKQPTPIRETITASSGRLSKSVPREGFDDHRAEVLGFVKAGEGPANKAGGDMDYQEYMNIINKVRKSKEIERVRTEQLRLASMYAREKKRQEELKKEEERLQRERVKIDEEKNHPPPTKPAAMVAQQTFNPGVVGNNRQNNSTVNVNSTRTNDLEKGQIDNDEVEQKKISPQRRVVEAPPDSFPAPPVEEKRPKAPLTTFQPKQFVPGHSTSAIQQPKGQQPASNNFQSFVPQSDFSDGVRSEREEQLRLEQMWLEQRHQQVKVEQENLERLREEQLRQEKEREEIRRLEVERLRQIQEEQKRLEEERRRQEEQMRLEQMRLEEERKRQEKLQAEKNAEYNRQRLDIEAKNIAALQEEQRASRERQRQQQQHEEQQQQQQLQQQNMSFASSSDRLFSPQEKVINDRLVKQDKLREEHKREEAKIRQEKLNLINQEEMLIKRQEDMLRQIEAERENLAKQELLIRTRQQDRLKQVRQEKQLLEKQEETLLLREQQLIQEKIRQEQLREEQRVLREQEEAIKKRQEEISKELMEELSVPDGITVCQALEGQVFRRPNKPMVMPMLNDHGNQMEHNDSKASTSPPPLQYIPAANGVDMNNTELDLQQVEDDGEGSYYSGSESDEDTLDEDGYYESKVEVKQNATSVPTTVRTIETKIDNPPWAPITPYLCYPEKQNVSHAQEEITAIFSQCKNSQYTKDGVVTSPESMRTSTNMITTPESSISIHSQVSQTEPRSRQSSYSPPPLPPLPTDEVQTDLFLPVQPDIPPRGDSYSVYSSAAETASSISLSETTNKKDFLDTSSCSSSASQLSPRLGGPGSAFKPYASSENLFDPIATNHVQDLPPIAPTHNYPLRNGEITDSRFLMKMQNGSRDDFRGPVHGKVRELRKQPVKAPFSTTDTEPEMRECNLSTLDSRNKKGSKKQIVYSTSETEEEYQAYLRSKPKWHGKGGHKDSWDPLLIQSPPQITQKPVGVIPKPQAALAVVPAVERGVQAAPAVIPAFAPVVAMPQPTQMLEIKVPENHLAERNIPERVFRNEQQLQPQQQRLQLQQEQQQQQLLQFKQQQLLLQQQQQQQLQQPEPAKLPMQTIQFPVTERVQKSNSIVEVRKLEQSLPLSVAEINRKSITESQSLLDVLNSKQNENHKPVELKEPTEKSLSFIMKQSMEQQPVSSAAPKLNSQLSQSIKPPPFMSQNGGEEREINEIMSNKFPGSPMLPRAIRTPTSKLVSEMDSQMKKERSPFMQNHNHNGSNSSSDNVFGRVQANAQSKSFSDQFLSQKNFGLKNNSEPNQTYADNGQEPGSKFAPQKELQQKLMNEALQRIGDRKEMTKKHFSKVTRTNPTIAAMEIMTRKEIKQGEMEERLARGEVTQIPIPSTPLHMKQSQDNLTDTPFEASKPVVAQPNVLMTQNIDSRPQLNSYNSAMLALLEQQTQKSRSSEVAKNYSIPQQPNRKPVEQQVKPLNNLKEQPKAAKKTSLPNSEIEKQTPVIVLKKEPKRLDPNEIKARSIEIEKQESKDKITPQPAKKASFPTNPSSEAKIISTNNEPKQVSASKPVETAKLVKKLSNADKVAEALRASKAQTSPKILPESSSKGLNPPLSEKRNEMAARRAPSQTPTKLVAEVRPMSKTSDSERKRDSDDISESEFSRQAVRKAAERFEKVAAEESTQRAPPPSLSSLGARGRSKSIGHSLAQKLQEADEEVVRPVLPWASNMSGDEQQTSRRSPAPVKRRMAMKSKGYQLRMSKSSDSITAAKLLAEARMKNESSGGGLRINQNMSKSIEQQIDVYTKTREEIRKILQVAKTCSVTDRVRLFDSQHIYEGETYEERTREQKAEAIRREILELKAQNQEQLQQEGSNGEVQIQSPIESKVKPLKIPMKPKMVDGGGAKQGQRGVPGATLRINQPPGLQTSPQPPEVKSILRSSRSIERNPMESLGSFKGPSLDAIPQRRGSMENIGSVKSRIDSYLSATEEELQQQQQQQQQPQQQSMGQHLKSILVNSERKKKSPKLVHSGDSLNIYTQSATDYSEDDDEIALRNRHMESHLLQIPEHPEKSFALGVRKSKSFATAGGQYECNMDEKDINEKKKTMMAFFAADIAAQRASLRSNGSQTTAIATIPSATASARYVAATTQKRGSITSISDEILGDDDLRDVDAVFESLLNSTFDENSSSVKHHMSRREAAAGQASRHARSKSSHPLLQLQQQESAPAICNAPAQALTKSEKRKSSGRTSSVTRKPSKCKLVAGEVKAVHIQQQQQQELQRSHSHGNSMLAAHIEQRRAGEEAIFKKIADPVAALPTSHTKKYLPRQQTWGAGSPTQHLGQGPNHTPSPTLSAPNSPHFLSRHGGATAAKPEEKKLSPFDKFRDMDNQNNVPASPIAPGRLTRQASLPSVCANGPRSAPPPIDQQQQQQNGNGNSPVQKRSVMSRSPSSAKELLLMWAQARTNTYPNMNVTNFSTSWNDGLAFCALLHYYYPEAFDFESLDPKNRRENFELAFTAAEEYAGICPLLDVEDMVMMIKPDWKCVFTYVQSFYRRFRNGRDPPPPTRTLALQPEQVSINASGLRPISTKLQNDDANKAMSPEKQKSLLSKYLLDDEEEHRQKVRTTKFRPPLPTAVSFSSNSLGEKNQQKFEHSDLKQRPPLTSSLSLSSYPTSSKSKSNSSLRLTSVEEKMSESDCSKQDMSEKNKNSENVNDISSVSVNLPPKPCPIQESQPEDQAT